MRTQRSRIVYAKRLDTIDVTILSALQQNSRMTNVELARRVGLSAPPCLRRLRRLESLGYILGFADLIGVAMEGGAPMPVRQSDYERKKAGEARRVARFQSVQAAQAAGATP